MSACNALLRRRPAKAATALLGRAPRTRHTVARRFPGLISFPIRSAAPLMAYTRPLLLAVVVWLCGGRPALFHIGLGRLLRSTHLDDLPQFPNVIWGQLLVIGPRLERPHPPLLES